MSALAAGPRPRRMMSEEIAASMGTLLNVSIRMDQDPENAKIENCERFLKTAAHAIMQLWDDVQAEKGRRGKVIAA